MKVFVLLTVVYVTAGDVTLDLDYDWTDFRTVYNATVSGPGSKGPPYGVGHICTGKGLCTSKRCCLDGRYLYRGVCRKKRWPFTCIPPIRRNCRFDDDCLESTMQCCGYIDETNKGTCSYKEEKLCDPAPSNPPINYNPLNRNFGFASNLPSGSIGAQPGFIQGYQQPGTPGQGFGQNEGVVRINPLGVSASGPSICSNWCRSPQGQYYCCEGAN